LNYDHVDKLIKITKEITSVFKLGDNIKVKVEDSIWGIVAGRSGIVEQDLGIQTIGGFQSPGEKWPQEQHYKVRLLKDPDNEIDELVIDLPESWLQLS